MCICLQDILSEFEPLAQNLIPVLQKIQAQFGYLSEESMKEAAIYLKIPESRVYAVATFYAQFRFRPIGKNHVLVCKGTACHVNGSDKVLQELEKHLEVKNGDTSENGEYTLETVACIGACGLAPCIMVNNKVEAKIDPEKISGLFQKNS